MELLFYPVMAGAVLLPAAWALRRQPPLEAVATGAALGVILWGAVALLRFFLVLPSGMPRTAGLVALALAATAGIVLWLVTRDSETDRGEPVPRTVWAALAGGALLILGLEASLPSFGAIQWSFDWWLHFDLARFYLVPIDPWRVYPGGDVITSRTPLYNLLGSLALAIFGNRFSIFQLFTAAIGWLWLLPAALLARRFGGANRAALLGLLALGPLIRFASVYTWPKALVTFFLLLALERTLAFRRAPSARAPRIAVEVGLVSGAAVLTHAGFVGFLFPIAVVIVYEARKRGDLRLLAYGMAATALVIVPWFAWGATEFGWQRGLLGYYHSQGLGIPLLTYGVQRLVMLVTGIVPVTPPILGLAQGYFLIYLGSAVGVFGLVAFIWAIAQNVWVRQRGANGWKLALWFALSGMVTGTLLSRQFTVDDAATLYAPAVVILAVLAIGARRIPPLVRATALLETVVLQVILLVWIWSPAASGQPNAQLAALEHVRFLGQSAWPAGLAMLVSGILGCLPALGVLRSRFREARAAVVIVRNG